MKKLFGLIILMLTTSYLGADNFKNSHWTFTAEWNKYTIKARRVGTLPGGTIDFGKELCTINNPKSQVYEFYFDGEKYTNENIKSQTFFFHIEGEFLFIGDFAFFIEYKGEDTVVLDPRGHGDNPLDYDIIMKRK